MSTLKVDTLQTTGGAGLFPARAWVNYDMTTVSLLGSGNISSLTDGGTGIATLAFSTSLTAATYSFTTCGYHQTGQSNIRNLCQQEADSQLTSSSTLRMLSNNSAGLDAAFNKASWTL